MSVLREKPLVLVTGFSSGIGKEFVSAKRVKEKYSFCFLGRNKPERMRAGDFFVEWDLRKPEPADESHGPKKSLEAIVLHQGLLVGRDFREISEQEMMDTINVNLLAGVRIVKRFSPLLTRDATIVFYSSISARKGSFDDIYALSKAGVEAFANSIVDKLSPSGVRVVCVAPGLVSGTEMTSQLKPGLFEKTLAKIPLGRPASPRAIANMVGYILSDKDLTISGGAIQVNGGQFIG